jgi:hypothetical protein
VKENDDFNLILKTLRDLGFDLSPLNHRNTNGPDLIGIKNGFPYRIEMKKTRRLKSGSLQVNPVEPNRRGDDLIAIDVNGRYVLVEPMADHLKCCSTKGYRTLTELG